MMIGRLKKHVDTLCRRNLKSDRVKCCAQCPFEDDITELYPGLESDFERKREWVDYCELHKKG
jgi:hypothetical protein